MPGPVSDSAPSLADRMRAFAKYHPEYADELEKLASSMDNIPSPVDEKAIRRLLGIWARCTKRFDEIMHKCDIQ